MRAVRQSAWLGSDLPRRRLRWIFEIVPRGGLVRKMYDTRLLGSFVVRSGCMTRDDGSSGGEMRQAGAPTG